jgi:hypothetical protein
VIVLIVVSFSIFVDFSGSAGHKAGSFLPDHEKNAKDLEIGHESIIYVI